MFSRGPNNQQALKPSVYPIYAPFLHKNNNIESVAMSAAGQPTEHLTQQELSEKDKGILAGLKNWLCHAMFDARSNICIDSSLSEKCALLREMDLTKSVSGNVHNIVKALADLCLVCTSHLSNTASTSR